MRSSSVKRIFKRSVSFVICLIMLLSCCFSSVFADRFNGPQCYSTITPSGDMLHSISTRYSLPFGISQTISSPYQLNIIKFKTDNTPVSDGYYCAYSTSRWFNGSDNWDTLGQIYSMTQSGLLFKTYYAVPYTERDDNGGVDSNFSIVFRAPKNTDLYLCSRAKSSNNAYYTVHIKPNDDKITSRYGGTWVVDLDGKYTTDSVLGIYTSEKRYLNQQQTAIYYSFLLSVIDDYTNIQQSLHDGPIGFLEELIDIGALTFEFLSIITDSYDLMSLGISATSDLANYTLGLSRLSPVQQFCNDVAGMSYSDVCALKNDITSVAHVTHTGVGVWTWHADHGVVIDSKKSIITWGIQRYVTAYDSYELVGERYEKGTWQ